MKLKYDIYATQSGSEIIYPYNLYEFVDIKQKKNDRYTFEDITDAELLSSSIYPFIETDIPNLNYSQSLIEITPIFSESKYYQQWEVGLLDPAIVEYDKSLEWKSIRVKRTELLQDSDWVLLPYSPITGSKLDEWVQYRENLRNITNNDNPFEIEWPTKPE